MGTISECSAQQVIFVPLHSLGLLYVQGLFNEYLRSPSDLMWAFATFRSESWPTYGCVVFALAIWRSRPAWLRTTLGAAGWFFFTASYVELLVRALNDRWARLLFIPALVTGIPFVVTSVVKFFQLVAASLPSQRTTQALERKLVEHLNAETIHRPMPSKAAAALLELEDQSEDRSPPNDKGAVVQ